MTEYSRGQLDGEILARLTAHDRDFLSLSESIDNLTKEVHKIVLATQRLSDQATAREITVVTTAAALKESEEVRRSKSEQAWSPVTKLFAVIATVATLPSLFSSIAEFTH